MTTMTMLKNRTNKCRCGRLKVAVSKQCQICDFASRKSLGPSSRMMEAATLYAGGLPLKQVAHKMGIKRKTVDVHMSSIRRALKMESSVHLVHYLLRTKQVKFIA